MSAFSVTRSSGRGLAVGIAAVAAALAIAVLPLELAAAAVGGVIAAVAVAVRPELGLLLLAFSVPFESIRQLPLGGFNAGSTEGLVAMTVVGWSLHLAAFRRPLRLPALTAPLWLLLGVGAVSAVSAKEPALVLKEALKWAELLAVWVVGVNVLGGRRAGFALAAALVLAGASEALIGVAQFFLRLGPPAFRFGPFLRAFGTFNQPNPYGGYLISVAPLALALALFGWRSWRAGAATRWAWIAPGAAAVMMTAALAMSLSRGAWIGFGVAALLVAALWDPRTVRYVGLALLVGVLVSAAGVANLLPASVTERFTVVLQYFEVFDVRDVALSPQNWAVAERMTHWQAAWFMFADNPWGGIGWGNYPAVYPDIHQLEKLPIQFKDPLGHAHNLYLNLLAEVGLAGLVAYLVFWGGAITLTARAARRLAGAARSDGRDTEAGWRAAVTAGALGGFAAMTLHNLFDNLTVHALLVQVALLLALVYANATRERTVPAFPR